MNNTQEVRPTRGFRRLKALIDLNVAPRDQEETSLSVNLLRWFLPSLPVPTTMIDVDAIDDDVVESSASDFAEAVSKSSGSRRRRVESGGTTTNKRRRVPPNQPVIDCEHVPETSKAPASAPLPPEEPKFSCPICMCPFTEEMTTKCGHIFCKGCIKMAISKQGKCPTCRKKVTARELIRVFLPSTR
ncbi:unnamed protein product [Eruca vesicaria subsp. sativa]|uniref:RING-type domain-containing protein n=1 Tax=Eruca vesicaria subsp. sativa TaxID=29727 RepID=A0ABC8KNA1_ERUVS|nr:unnamed protein product [Eruca vesicaria subsp. sativa]